MNKIILMAIIFILVLCLNILPGCVFKDETPSFCLGMMQNSELDQGIKIYMENNICVIEEKNYSHVTSLNCRGLGEHYTILLKSKENVLADQWLKKNCQVISLD